MAYQDKSKKASYNELAAKEIAPSSITSVAPAVIVGTSVPTPAASVAPAAPVASPAPVAPTVTASPQTPPAPTAEVRFEEMQRVLRQRIIRNIGGKYVEDGENTLEIYFEGGHKLKITGKFQFSFSR